MTDSNQEGDRINRRNILKSIALLGSAGTAGLSIGRVSGEAVATSSTTYRNYLDQLHSEHGEIVDTSTVLNPTSGSGGASISTNQLICQPSCGGGGDDGGGGDGGDDGGSGGGGGGGGGGGTIDPNDPPVANATVGSSTVYVGESVQFSGQGSSDPDGSINTYSWSFGDGHSENGKNVTHSFSSPGTYSGSLTVEDYSSATDTDSVSIRVSYGYKISVDYEDGYTENFFVYFVGNRKALVKANDLSYTVELTEGLINDMESTFGDVKDHDIDIPEPSSTQIYMGDEGTVTVFGEDDFKCGASSVNYTPLEGVPVVEMTQRACAGWWEGGRIEAGTYTSLAGGADAIAESFIDKKIVGNQPRTGTIEISGDYLTTLWVLFAFANIQVELFCREKSDSGWIMKNETTIVNRSYSITDMANMVNDPLSTLDMVAPTGETKSGSLDGVELTVDFSPNTRYQIGVRAKCSSLAAGNTLGVIPNTGSSSVYTPNQELNNGVGDLKSLAVDSSDLPLIKEQNGRVKINALNIVWGA